MNPIKYKILKKNKGLRQFCLEHGLNYSTVYRVINDDVVPNVDTLCALDRALGGDNLAKWIAYYGTKIKEASNGNEQ